MADIAMLVAEEYERRLRVSRGKQEEVMKSDSCAAVLGLKLKSRIGHLGMEVSKLGFDFEPKSQIGVAAFHGAFSA
ncbi:hypothetical protein like AT5G65207 [Hibiscus trionum]|uniref:Uncharacterized protein n=1 Tax=Hibiscus trionum TaxID=183268 RepID=A0A9W7LLR2_HIBTR|nr:hypothetical protein like AT5G65207 [Hibiscus trionum]